MNDGGFYAKVRIDMTGPTGTYDVTTRFYLFGSRPATHVVFWLAYYVLFSLIWMKPEQGYFASFYLEFVLLPPRALAVYGMIYYLMPRYLLEERYGAFISGYAALLVLAALLQRLSGFYFYDGLLLGDSGPLADLVDLGAFVRSLILVNTTVIVVGAAKLYQFYLVEKYRHLQHSTSGEPLTLKANRRTHIVDPADVMFIEAMGNYVTYYLKDGQKLVVYGSIKSAAASLPEPFVRLQRSYIVNRKHISSFTAEKVYVGTHELPRGKDTEDELLMV